MTVASTSGIRGVFNSDLLPEEIAEYSRNFVRLVGGGELLLGRDTRSTGPIVSRVVASAVLGTISRKSTEYTPSRTRYTRRDNDRRGLVLPIGNRVLHIEGANDATVDARLEALPAARFCLAHQAAVEADARRSGSF